jgi:hypothetical protein
MKLLPFNKCLNKQKENLNFLLNNLPNNSEVNILNIFYLQLKKFRSVRQNS